jgi:hypothetical protein
MLSAQLGMEWLPYLEEFARNTTAARRAGTRS